MLTLSFLLLLSMAINLVLAVRCIHLKRLNLLLERQASDNRNTIRGQECLLFPWRHHDVSSPKEHPDDLRRSGL